MSRVVVYDINVRVGNAVQLWSFLPVLRQGQNRLAKFGGSGEGSLGRPGGLGVRYHG